MKIITNQTISGDAEFCVNNRNELTTHPCEVGSWWGEEVCRHVIVSDIMEELKLSEGEYKIEFTITKI